MHIVDWYNYPLIKLVNFMLLTSYISAVIEYRVVSNPTTEIKYYVALEGKSLIRIGRWYYPSYWEHLISTNWHSVETRKAILGEDTLNMMASSLEEGIL